MFKSIVVGIDGSKASETALRVACDLARKYDSAIHLVHTPQPATVAFATGAVAGYHAVTTMPSEADVQEAADKIVTAGKNVMAEYDQTPASVDTTRGDPVKHIVTAATDHGADLIVTGRRGLGAVGALMQGSTSLGISHRAECAFLSVA